MTRVKPFAALRPTRECASTVAALPYDVQSQAEARQIVAKNPQSFLAIDEPVVNFPEGTDSAQPEIYERAGECLAALKANGVLEKDSTPQFYLYELTRNGRAQNGIVCCIAVDDYENDVVKKHEKTRVDKETDRINHIKGCKAQTGPIFLAYHADPKLSQVCAAAKQDKSGLLFDFVADDDVRHRGFTIPAALEATVIERFDATGDVYVADGHHRLAAAAAVAKARQQADHSTESAESDYFLAVLFADDELEILPYQRVVRDLGDLSPAEFIDILTTQFHGEAITDAEGHPVTISDACNPEAKQAISALIEPRKNGEFSAFVEGTWHRCVIDDADASDNPLEGLEATLLQTHLFEPILGITDPRRDPRIDFVGGVRGLEELERRCKDDCVAAFALTPTRIEELFAVADAGLLMPPKSTWFEPKLRSGLFLHEI